MAYKVLYCLVLVLECIFAPLFIKYGWPDKCKKSLATKMIAATMFVLSGIFAMLISGNDSQYAKLILLGLVFGWLGDLFLHLLTDKMVYFAIGVVAFLTGHVFYIIAFTKAARITYPNASNISWYEVVIGILAFAMVFVFAKVIKKLKTKWYMIAGIGLYALTIITMLVKALRYTIGEWLYGTNDHMVMIFVTVALGAILFVLSDGSLGVILAGKKNKYLRMFNLVTYFAAQCLIAASIFFVQTRVLYGT